MTQLIRFILNCKYNTCFYWNFVFSVKLNRFQRIQNTKSKDTDYNNYYHYGWNNYKSVSTQTPRNNSITSAERKNVAYRINYKNIK